MADNRWRIASAALSVSPDYTDPRVVNVSCNNNVALWFFDKRFWDRTYNIDHVAGQWETDNYETNNAEARDTLEQKWSYTPQGTYRSWQLNGYTTMLGSDMEPSYINDIWDEEEEAKRTTVLCHAYGSCYYGIYARLDANGDALLVFSIDTDRNVAKNRSAKPYIQWNKKTIKQGDEEITVNDYKSVQYIWLPLGEISTMGVIDNGDKKEYTRRTMLTDIDYGCLGTSEGIQKDIEEAVKGDYWYDTDANNKEVSLKEGWIFRRFRTKILGMRLFSDPSKWHMSDTFLVTSDDPILASDTDYAGTPALIQKVNASKDQTLSTTSWIIGPFVTWLRSLFVQKDTTGTEVMQGSLQSVNLTATANTTTRTLHATGTSSLDGITTAPSITTANVDNTHDETIGGLGSAIYAEQSGSGHIVTDFLAVRKAAWFRSVTIEEVKHVGGELILSQAACQISRVVQINENYRCYFPTEANGKRQYNEWAVGDQARCQVCNLTAGTSTDVRTKYYWRCVVGVHVAGENETEHYIVLSRTNCDPGSGVPEADDSIALLGHQLQAGEQISSRCSAQIYSTAETNAPSRRYYQGITSFSLADTEIEILEWDASTEGTHWRVGSGGSYIDFRKSTDNKTSLEIHADSISMGGSTKPLDKQIEELTQALADGIDIHTQTDASDTKEKYLTDHSSTLSNLKGMYWIDMNGMVYTLEYVNGKYLWQSVTDQYLIDAVNTANSAKSAADKAQKDADRAITELTDISSDKVVTPSEKISILAEHQKCRANHTVYAQQYDKYQYITDSSQIYAEYISAMQTLIGRYDQATDTWDNSGYHESILKAEGNSYFYPAPVLADSDESLSFSVEQYNTAVTDYYQSVTRLLNHFVTCAETAAKTYADKSAIFSSQSWQDMLRAIVEESIDKSSISDLNRSYLSSIQNRLSETDSTLVSPKYNDGHLDGKGNTSSDFEKRYTAYTEAYANILQQIDDFCDFDTWITNMVSKRPRLLTAITTYTNTLESFMSCKGDFVFELSAYKNQLSNFFSYNAEGDLVITKESGLITEAEYAKLFASYKEDGITKEAQIKTYLEDKDTRILLSADKIDLRGYTTINNKFSIDEKGIMHASTGDFSGLVKQSVVCINRDNAPSYINIVNEPTNKFKPTAIMDVDTIPSNFAIFDHEARQISANCPTGFPTGYSGNFFDGFNLPTSSISGIYINLPACWGEYFVNMSDNHYECKWLEDEEQALCDANAINWARGELGYISPSWNGSQLKAYNPQGEEVDITSLWVNYKRVYRSKRLMTARSMVGCSITITPLTDGQNIYVSGIQANNKGEESKYINNYCQINGPEGLIKEMEAEGYANYFCSLRLTCCSEIKRETSTGINTDSEYIYWRPEVIPNPVMDKYMLNIPNVVESKDSLFDGTADGTIWETNTSNNVKVFTIATNDRVYVRDEQKFYVFVGDIPPYSTVTQEKREEIFNEDNWKIDLDQTYHA